MSVTLPFTPDVPGRGAWTRTGGLLPLKPGNTHPQGYYRAPAAGEEMIGLAWARGRDTSHTAHVVNVGARTVQALCGLKGAAIDGVIGAQTGAAINAKQAALGVTADGIAGPATMRALLTPIITTVARAHDLPIDVLGGLATFESGLDPAAVGVNGVDTGICQINLAAHGDLVTLDEALDPRFALNWTADDLADVRGEWTGQTSADPLDIAIANHNSPKLAWQWARSGTPPVIEGRSIQIADYVAKVRAAWNA